jgi:GNAT superfamily N-acetyltransferase
MSTSTREAASIEVRRLSAAEWPIAFPVISQLRPLDEAEFLRLVGRQSYSGYELIGAFIDGKLAGVLGMRPVHSLARGPFLHIDDLIVAASHRDTGVGRALMDYAEADARERKMNWVFLDAKPDAVAFYERRDYVAHPAPSMKKAL